MSNVVDLDEHKKRQSMQESLEALRTLSLLPVEWRFRKKALRFMGEVGLDAADLLNIFGSAFRVSDFADGNTLVLSGFSIDGECFSFAISISEDPFCLKILKGWKNRVSLEKSA